MKSAISGIPIGKTKANLASMISENAAAYKDKTVLQWRGGAGYTGITWNDFLDNIRNIASNLREHGFQTGDKMVLFSPNNLEMLELELAVMASGGIAVPLFAFFKKDTAELLIRHSDAAFLALAGSQQLQQVGETLPLKKIFVFDKTVDPRFDNLVPFSELLRRATKSFLDPEASPDQVCLHMYTSGTMGTPKCVQLTHGNILSQRAALEQLWEVNENDRFLSYLPWHHSFGGIFELFSALYHGATLSLESGHGKNMALLMENWNLVKPTVFFSVPKVYESLIDLCRKDAAMEQVFFHPNLKFVFTAAAPMSKNISDEFEKRNIRVYEGWGLTETSPCCTLTDPEVKREPGTVGFPIPGVNLRIAEDGEIQVQGPNVMKGYYRNDNANREAFTVDGWYRTGDVGEITPYGLKLVARKDRIFKLSNGEKVIPSEMETLIQTKCHYVSYALVEGSGRQYPVAILFPNKKMLETPDYELSPMEGCFCPRNLDELGKCLQGCLRDANCGIKQKFAKIKSAIIIDDELSIENSTLTPSLKMAPKNVLGIYKAHLENMYGEKHDLKEPVYVIHLEQPVKELEDVRD